MMNDQLPKNVDSEQEFYKYRDKFDCFYTMDDFMEEYRISKSTAKKLLQGVDHLSITQSLYTRLNKKFDGMGQKLFYNREGVFKALVEDSAITFSFNHMPTKENESGQREPIYTEVQKEPIPVVIIHKLRDYFMDIAINSGTVPEMGKLFDETSPTDRKRNNRNVKQLEGIEICIGERIKRYQPLISELFKTDAMISYILGAEINEHKK